MRQILSSAGHLVRAVGLAALLAAGVACGSGAGAETKSGSERAGGARASVDAAGAITVIGKDNSFEPKQFSAKAGKKVTVTLQNKGAAIHNFALKGQMAPDGKEVQTALLPGGQSGTVEFTLAAGGYDYYCTVHPVEMTGKLTVD